MSFVHAIHSLGEGLKDALAPARCIQCLTEGTWFCMTCRRNPPPHNLQCFGCKRETMSGRTCSECADEISLKGYISAYPYSLESIRRGIKWLKFKGIRPLAEILAGLIIPKLTAIAPFDELSTSAVLIPLPLHSTRYLQRGFNQSEEIARAISDICSIQTSPLLVRTAATAPQANLPHDLRERNMSQAFSLSISDQEYKNLARKKPLMIIIDDVATSGATLLAASQALPPLHNVQIWGASIARG